MMGAIGVLATLFVFGTGLLVASDRLRRRWQRGAQVLAASGIVLFFFLSWSATEDFRLVPWWVGSGLVFATSMLAGVLSVRHGYPLPILGIGGGLVAAGSLSFDDAPPLAPVSLMALVLFGMLFVPSLITRIPWKRVAPTLGLHQGPAKQGLQPSDPQSAASHAARSPLRLPFPPASPWIEGERRGFAVVVFQHDRALGIVVRGVDPGFTLRRQVAMDRLGGADVETGDPDFDGRTRIKGDVHFVLALLDHSTRRKVDDLLEQRYDGVLDGTIRKRVFDFQEIRPALESMLDLAEALRRPPRAELPMLIAQRALEDPSPGVRRAAEAVIAQIRSRLGGSQAGELSLATEGTQALEGAVSRAADGETPFGAAAPGGEVSLVDVSGAGVPEPGRARTSP